MKFKTYGPERLQDVRLLGARLDNLPAQETCSGPSGIANGRTRGLSRRHRSLVGSDHLRGGAALPDLAAVEPQGSPAQPPDLVHLMSDEQDGAAAARHLSHLP